MLVLYTYNTRPKNVDINKYIKKGQMYNTMFAVDQIIKSGGFETLRNALIENEKNDMLIRLTHFQIEEYQYNKGIITEKTFKDSKQILKHTKQNHKQRLSYYSSLTPNQLMNKVKEKQLLPNDPLLVTLKDSIGEYMTQPLFNLNFERIIETFDDNPFITDAFEDSFNSHFTTDHTIYPVTKDRINEVYHLLNSYINDPEYLNLINDHDKQKEAIQFLSKIEPLTHVSDDTWFIICDKSKL